MEGSLVGLLIVLVVLGVVFGLIVWALERPGNPLPQPFKWAIEIVLVLIFVVILLSYLPGSPLRLHG